MSVKELSFKENFQIAEAMKKSQEENMGLGGVIVIEDPALNRILEVRKNLITLRGRTFALEQIFNSAPPVESDYLNNPNRQILLFRVGSGGTPSSQPFNPIPASANDTEMAQPAPFRIVDPSDTDTFLTSTEADIYKDPRDLSGGDLGKIGYFSKRFDNFDPEWVWNPVDNKTYKHLRLMINSKDARDLTLNETGLVIARNDNFEEMELFSRVTFSTEFMNSETNKALLIHYYVYA